MAVDKPKIDWNLVKPTTAGQVSPDVKRDTEQRQADASLRKETSVKQQARTGEVPMPGEKAVRPTLQHPVAHPAPAKDVPKHSGTEGAARAEPRHQEPSAAVSQRAAPNHDMAAMNQLVEAGKKALSDLNKLAQGGQKVLKTVVTPAATPQATLHNALINQFALSSKKSAQPGKETAKLPEKEMPATVAKEDGNVRQPGERVGAEKMAEAVAQKNPFAVDARAGRAEKREAKDDVKTDRRAAERLGSVTEGVARGIVAASGTQEFSGGSYSGGFGDPSGESAGLAGKVGAAPQIHVYGENEIYVETEALYANLGLTRVLYGQEELRERVNVSIGDRISNTRDDVPLSERMGDGRYLQQAAFGSRGSVYGPGKMVG